MPLSAASITGVPANIFGARRFAMSEACVSPCSSFLPLDQLLLINAHTFFIIESFKILILSAYDLYIYQQNGFVGRL